jgi:hypothetical protein
MTWNMKLIEMVTAALSECGIESNRQLHQNTFASIEEKCG